MSDQTSRKTMLTRPDIVLASGVRDPLTASLRNRCGVADALYLSGASIAYTRLGRPDIGLVSMRRSPRRLS